MTKILISFRNNDTEIQAQRLAGALRQPGTLVGMGIASMIQSDEDSTVTITRILYNLDVLVVMVGPNWAGDWLNDVNDPDRIVISAAFNKQKKIVVVSVNGGTLPASLPDDLARLALLSPITITGFSFHDAMEKIVAATGKSEAQRAAEQSYALRRERGEEVLDYESVEFYPTKEKVKRGLKRHPAGAGARFFASLIDSFILNGIGYFIGLTLGGWMARSYTYSTYPQALQQTQLMAACLGIFINQGYYILTMCAWDGQTVGKRVLGIRVVRLDGEPITVGTVLARNLLGYFISAIVLGLGFLWILFDENKQGWHDKIAGTIVVKDD